jgi:hypothetical protein
MKTSALTALLFASLCTASAFAGTCEITTTRTACPGKESISYKKCDGKPTCADFQDLADANQCKAAALAACENARLTITKSKVITAKFDGAELKTDAGNADFCSAYAKRAEEFNKC